MCFFPYLGKEETRIAVWQWATFLSDVGEEETWTWVLHGALSQAAGHELCGATGEQTPVGPHSSRQTLGPFQMWTEEASHSATEDPTNFFAK